MPSWHNLFCFITACRHLPSNRIRLHPGARHPKTPVEKPNPVGWEPERETPWDFACGNGSMVWKSMISGAPIITFSCILNNYQRNPPFPRPMRFSLASARMFLDRFLPNDFYRRFFLFFITYYPMPLSLSGLVHTGSWKVESKPPYLRVHLKTRVFEWCERLQQQTEPKKVARSWASSFKIITSAESWEAQCELVVC